MRRFALSLFLMLIFVLSSFAQENEQTPYEIALQRIEEAWVSGARVLDLASLDITELPPEIGQLSNLQILHLSFNQLSDLPPEIGQLSKLQILYLSFNQLSDLPPEIGQLSNLQELHLHGNNLITLPPEIGNLSDLCVLDLTFNRLQRLPTNLGRIVLKRENCSFNLDNNPLISPPPEVVTQGTEAILDYLRNEAWWHLQRLIAGAAGGVGIVAAIVLGLRWKNRRGRKEKEKRG